MYALASLRLFDISIRITDNRFRERVLRSLIKREDETRCLTPATFLSLRDLHSLTENKRPVGNSRSFVQHAEIVDLLDRFYVPEC